MAAEAHPRGIWYRYLVKCRSQQVEGEEGGSVGRHWLPVARYLLSTSTHPCRYKAMNIVFCLVSPRAERWCASPWRSIRAAPACIHPHRSRPLTGWLSSSQNHLLGYLDRRRAKWAAKLLFTLCADRLTSERVQSVHGTMQRVALVFPLGKCWLFSIRRLLAQSIWLDHLGASLELDSEQREDNTTSRRNRVRVVASSGSPAALCRGGVDLGR